MKKFLKEFKEFALKGNVVDMAIGVIIAGAFSAIVTSFTTNIINPIIASLGGTEFGLVTPLANEQFIDWGAFISAVINFIIMALVLFFMLKAFKKAEELTKKPEPEPEPAPQGPTEMEQIISLLNDIKNK